MNILVTGAYGQLGSELSSLAADFSGAQFFFTDYDSLDITDAGNIDRFFRMAKPDMVINCAAYTAVDLAEKEQEKAVNLNVTGPGLLAEACRVYHARLIHVSTDYVFNGSACVPYDEDIQADPQGIYGLTKLDGENRVRDILPEAVIIRTSWLYSQFGNNFVKTMLRLGRERQLLRVVFDQAGTPTYARDLANAILHLIRASETPEGWKSGIYHYSNEGVCSWYDFAREIFDIAGIACMVEPIRSSEYPTPAKRPSFSVLDKGKIKNTYNLAIPYWRDSLKDCIKRLQT
jgi:dTDP-4-dehydrorhamnose reductase